ncbi:hypothetical protein AMS68_002045 [Peltaster fructicola]|uniref:CoA carboxyltransferase C-terminal domain-containing protein n=1 Tax=Peltaster fructicola TaxID=286661 RepID=A0A6H0XPH0_9PEZI|nr:hypothetical protein AMS68_002045 [Peltaster fructicola]
MSGKDDHAGKGADKDASGTANARLVQITEQVAAPNTRRRRQRAKQDELPADYSDILGHIKTLKTLATTPPKTTTGYQRQIKAGKLWVRDRVNQLLDPDTFVEIGSISGTVEWKQLSNTKEEPVSFVPSNNVQGFGRLHGREIIFTADDFSIRAGHADGALHEKTYYMEKLAVTMKLPMIKLVDGSSGGGSVTTIKTMAYSYVPPLRGMDYVVKQLNMGIPNLGAVLGPAIGLGAARVVSCHFSVMAGNVGSLFNAGPKVVAGATFEEGLSLEELGGPETHCTNGTIDNLAMSEGHAFEQIRTVLGYLPNCGTQIPPVVEAEDRSDRSCPELRTAIPRRRERMYDVRRILHSVVDQRTFFEIGPLWGRTVVVGLARLGGRPVGIVANNAEVNGGALDTQGSQKLQRHLKFCDVFNLPVVQFVDVPGYAVGTVAERQATMRWGVELTKAYYTTTIAIFTIIIRKSYGVAGGMMCDARDPHMRVGWPSGEWGSLPLDGGIDVGHSAELRKIEKEQGVEARKARYKELEEEYQRLMNPVRTANNFGIEEIIDPADTRRLVVKWCQHTYESDLPERVMRRMTDQLQPSFA